jgi:hypothetical protein
MKTGDIKPYKKNPRKNDKAVEHVMESIKNYGFKNPVLIDENNEIIAGHTRLKAAIQLGLTFVPTIQITDMNEDQKKGYRIADNKVSEYAEWDYDLLKFELEGVESFTGFEIIDLKLDYSSKNKEIDFQNFEENYVLKLNFKEKEYFYIKQILSEIEVSPEKALLKVLDYEI